MSKTLTYKDKSITIDSLLEEVDSMPIYTAHSVLVSVLNGINNDMQELTTYVATELGLTEEEE